MTVGTENEVLRAKVETLESATRLLESLRKLADALRVSVKNDKRGH